MLCLFLHLLVDICTFWLSWVMLLWTLLYKYLFMSLLSVLLGIWLGVKLLDHMVILCLTFWRTAKLVFHTIVPFSIPTSNAQEFQLLHILAKLVFLLKKNRYPNGCELVFHKVFFTMFFTLPFSLISAIGPNTCLFTALSPVGPST